jgi:prepilin-type N-terminal cleavage/methylation domain-containing protein
LISLLAADVLFITRHSKFSAGLARNAGDYIVWHISGFVSSNTIRRQLRRWSADMNGMHKNTSRHNNTGFTLMELMAAIGVASILMTIAIPNFLAALPRLRLSDAARQVATDLQQVRMKAIAQNIPYQVSFSTTTYVLQRCNGPCANEGGSIQLPQGITITASTAPQFQPRGTAAAATTITLSNGSSSKWVCVRTVGRVSIQDANCS